MQQTLEQQEKSLRSFTKNRWLYTCVCLFSLAASVDGIFRKRSEWPFIIRLSLPPGVSIWHSIWENIITAAMISFIVISLWMRLYNYKREMMLTEQMALQKAAKPPEGVWPPPPRA